MTEQADDALVAVAPGTSPPETDNHHIHPLRTRESEMHSPGIRSGTVGGAVAIGLCALAVGILSVGPAQPASAAAGKFGGNVAIGWSIPNVPATGITNITFPITVGTATVRADGTYFAQQFIFTNAPDVGYTGLQPRPDSNGHQMLHAAFSSFNAGTTSTDPNCRGGADGGAGESCSADFAGVYGDTYDLTVTRTGADTWTGTATDAVTGVANHVGTYTLPTGSGDLKGWQVGFVEYYLGSPSCSQLPRIDVVFGGPSTTDAGGLTGTSSAEHEYSQCIGQADYAAAPVGSGTHITRGWPAGGSPTTTPGNPAPTSAAADPTAPTTPPAPPKTNAPTSKHGTTPTPTPIQTPTTASPSTPTPASTTSAPDVLVATPSDASPSAPSQAGQNAAALSTHSDSSTWIAVAAAVVVLATLAGGGWYRRRRRTRAGTRRQTP